MHVAGDDILLARRGAAREHQEAEAGAGKAKAGRIFHHAGLR
jgi:hypothetical protein